jgi:hypothetical protein
VREVKNRKAYEIAFHTLLGMVSIVSILQKCKKIICKITVREYQFFESVIEKNIFSIDDSNL